MLKFCVIIPLLCCATLGVGQPLNHYMGTPNQTNNPMLAHATIGGVSHLLMMTRGISAASLGHYRSTNNGTTWIGNDTIPSKHKGNNPWVAMDNETGYAYTTVIDGLFRSTDYGIDWDTANYRTDVGDESTIVVDNGLNSSYRGRVYMASSGGFYFSTNHGANWIYDSLQPPVSRHFQNLVVDGNGTLYDFAGENLAGCYSTTGGLTWDTLHAGITFNTSESFYRSYSVSAATNSGFVCVAAVYHDTLRIAWSNGIDSAWHVERINLGTEVADMPMIAVDSLDRIFIGFYDRVGLVGVGDTVISSWLVKLASSEDKGATWGITQVSSDTFLLAVSVAHPVSMFGDGNCGISFGVTVMDSGHIGVAWADNRADPNHWTDTIFTYFANVPLGVMFQNSFDQVHAGTLSFFPQSDTSSKTTVNSNEVRLLPDSTNFYVRSDFWRHNDISGPKNNFVFYQWNKGISVGAGGSDTNFTHPFTATGVRPSTQEASFTHIDSLTDSNNLEGATADSVKWGIGQFASANISTLSPFRLDSARRFVASSNFYFDFKAKSKIPNGLLTSPWDTSWFEAWSKNGKDTLVDTLTFSNVKLSSPTHIDALYKTHLKTADTNALSFNNARKICFNPDSNIHLLAYESRGNVYVLSSVNSQFCEFKQEWRINKDPSRSLSLSYGNAFNPGVAYLARPRPGPYQSPRRNTYVVWNEVDVDSANNVKHYRVMLRCDTVSNWQAPPVLVDSFSTGLANVDPPAPSVCAVQTNNGYTIDYVIRGAIAYHRDSTVWVAAIMPSLTTAFKHCIDNTLHGSYVSIEPGFFGSTDTSSASGDSADFHVTFQDTSNGNYGYDGGVRYRYLCFNPALGWVSRYPTDMIMNRYWTVSRNDMWGVPQHPSICVASDSSVIISYILDEKSTILAQPYLDSASVHRRSGMYTRIKSSYKGAWGLFRIVTKYSNNPVLYAPSVSCYDDLSGKYRVAWWRRDSLSPTTYTDSIEEGVYDYIGPVGASGRDYYPTDSMKIVVTGYRSRTPSIEYSQQTPSANSGFVSCKDSTSLPYTIKRGNVSGCDESDNSISKSGSGWYEMTVCVGKTFGRLAVGEFSTLSGSGTKQSIPLMAPAMRKPCATPTDVKKLNGTRFFKFPTDSCAVIFFRAPSTGDISGLSEFSTKSILFTTELVDSATDLTDSAMDVQAFAPTPATRCGYDTVWFTGHASSGKTYYVRTRIDTMGSFTSPTFSCARVACDDKLSDILTNGTGMGKQIMPMRDAGKAGEVPVFPNMIDLMIGPNPLSTTTHIFYTIPVEDADDIAEIVLFDIRGRDVSRLMHEMKSAGRHEIDFDGTRLPAGNYVLAVHLKNHMQAKMIGVIR